jgi:TonB-dependent receptor
VARLIPSISLLICLAITSPARADERTGTITGSAADASHFVLEGARVELQPRGQTTVTNQEGQFTIANLPPGEYTITISYLGMLPFTKELKVSGGAEVRVDAVLQVSAKEEITVTAARPRGEAQALNQQRTSDNIVQVLPAEVITSLPNTNVADAVGRLPSVSLERDEGEGKYVQIRGTDPRLSNLTINGVHVPSPEGSARNVKLDIIPSDIVGSIEVNKTLSANQEGDAIGGSVNLVTKAVGDEPYVSLSAMGGYTNIVGGRGLDQFGATYGSRFGQDKRVGALFGATYDWNGRGIDDIEPSPDMADFGLGPVPVVAAVDLREYRYYRSRVGAAGSMDYRMSGGASAYVRGLFSNFKNYGDRWVYSPEAGDFLTPSVTADNGAVGFGIQNRRPNEQIFSVSGGARQTLGAFNVDYEFSGSRARQNRLNQTNAKFDGPDDVAFGIDASDPYLPKFNVLNGVQIYDPTAYALSGTQVANDRTSERDLGGAVNFMHAYTAGTKLGSVAFGAKIRGASKTQVVDEQSFDATGAPNLALAQVVGTLSNPNYYSGQYQLGPLADLDKIISFISANPSAVELNESDTRQRSDPNNYQTTEHVYAAYVMNTLDFGNARLQAGLRIESTQASYTGYHVTIDADGQYVSTAPVSGSSNYTNALPSVQYKYAFDPNTNLRLVYGMGISRPNFSDLPPFIVQDDQGQTVSVGNPALKPTRSNNFDVLFERFLEPVGVIQAGVFYKALADPIYEDFETNITSGIYAGFTQLQPINGPKAHVAGIELTWQQHLSQLPGALGGLGVMANYSHTSSRAVVPGRTDDPALLRQAPNNWNLGLTYDRHALSARLGVSHNDASIYAYNYQTGADGGIMGPNGDVYFYPHTQVDAQASYTVRAGWDVVVALLNLNNEVFGFYQGSPQFQIQREFYNRTVSVGVRMRR